MPSAKPAMRTETWPTDTSSALCSSFYVHIRPFCGLKYSTFCLHTVRFTRKCFFAWLCRSSQSMPMNSFVLFLPPPGSNLDPRAAIAIGVVMLCLIIVIVIALIWRHYQCARVKIVELPTDEARTMCVVWKELLLRVFRYVAPESEWWVTSQFATQTCAKWWSA